MTCATFTDGRTLASEHYHSLDYFCKKRLPAVKVPVGAWKVRLPASQLARAILKGAKMIDAETMKEFVKKRDAEASPISDGNTSENATGDCPTPLSLMAAPKAS